VGSLNNVLRTLVNKILKKNRMLNTRTLTIAYDPLTKEVSFY